ncbi:MAG TPA: ATP-binding cassette domain-containing protein [Vicinamibacterales bacterium]|nr:ATP-binding cassette domain-containing protein [Vicinamibacterales bacterium]
MSTVLSVSGVRLNRGSRAVLRDLSFDVAPGAIVALMGLSGSGKTTALRAIAGLEPFDAGAIALGSATLSAGPLSAATRRATAGHVGMVFQFHHLFEHLTALDNVCLAPVHVQRRGRREAEDVAGRLLDELGVAHRAAAWPRELSGGEAQRVAIARALATNPPILLLDEPTASLDPARRGELGATFRQLASAGRALLVTCHDVTFVREFATECLILADGSVVERGDPQTVLDSPTHEATRALLRSA